MKTMIDYPKIKLFFKSIWNGVLGISSEMLLVYFFIFTGFLVCLVWWAIFK